MYLSEISLKQFRSYTNATFSFDPTLTLITGNNGIGKTNLLEAVYVLLQGGSFRVGDKDLIQIDESWWRLDGTLNARHRQLRYQLGQHPAKALVINEVTKRFMHKDRLPVVLFEPTDLQLIHGSPSRRRDSLDLMLSSLSKSYKLALGRYQRALLQRNNVLKKNPLQLEDALFSWDVLLSEYSVELMQRRYQLIADLNSSLSGYYAHIAGDVQELEIIYRSNLAHDVTGSKFLTSLHEKIPLDRIRGTTSVGPHRDDMDFLLRSAHAKYSASRGEIRTILLSLKLAYAQLLEAAYGDKPLILLDDVFSELDSERQYRLTTLLSTNQTIITDTKALPLLNGTHIPLN